MECKSSISSGISDEWSLFISYTKREYLQPAWHAPIYEYSQLFITYKQSINHYIERRKDTYFRTDRSIMQEEHSQLSMFHSGLTMEFRNLRLFRHPWWWHIKRFHPRSWRWPPPNRLPPIMKETNFVKTSGSSLGVNYYHLCFGWIYKLSFLVVVHRFFHIWEADQIAQ